VRRLAIALVHHPVLDRDGAIVTSAVTNLDVHDIARSARTYGASDYFVVHPIEAQRGLVERIVTHWREGSSAARIPDRKEALSVLSTVPSLEAAIERLGGRGAVELWATSARSRPDSLGYADASARLAEDGPAVLLVLGTSWGLAPEVVAACDRVLAPVGCEARGDGFNHLSVRAACAIMLDRLTSRR
jgi:hypothetical protein